MEHPPGKPPLLVLDTTDQYVDELVRTMGSVDVPVERVASARDCLRRLETGSVAAIYSGSDLPDLSGLRLLRAVRLEAPMLPFVLNNATLDAPTRAALEADNRTRLVTDEAPMRVADWLQLHSEFDSSHAVDDSHKRYHSLTTESPAPINVFAPDSVTIWGNDAVVELLGLDGLHDLVGRDIFEFIHPADHDVARSELSSVIEDDEPVGPTRMRLRRPDGDVRFIHVSTATGRFLGTEVGQAVVIDVTELQELQTRLATERHLVDSALDVLQDIFFVADPDGGLTRWNNTLSAVTGVTDDELASMPLHELVSAEDTHRVEDAIDTVLAVGEETVQVQVETMTGHTSPYEFRIRRFDTPAADSDVKLVGIGRDISRRVEREKQYAVLDRWLRHNIRNDATIIAGLAAEIQDAPAVSAAEIQDAPAVSAAEYAARIEERSNHLVLQADKERKLIGLLTDRPDRVRIDAATILGREATAARDRHPDATIEVDVPDSLRVRALPALGTAIKELVDNAVEHSPDGVTVTLTAEATDGVGRIAVQDDGPGFPPEERRVLNADLELSQLTHASGLGLVYVAWVVRFSDGTLGFIDREAGGTTVTIDLPLAGLWGKD